MTHGPPTRRKTEDGEEEELPPPPDGGMFKVQLKFIVNLNIKFNLSNVQIKLYF